MPAHVPADDTAAAPAPSRADATATAIAAGGAAMLLCAGALAGVVGCSLAFGLVGLVAALTLPHLAEVPQPVGTTRVLAASVVLMVVVDLLLPTTGNLRWLTVVLAIGLALAFVHELRRTDGRPHLVPAIAGVCLGLGVLGSGAFYAEVAHAYDARVVVALVAVVSAAVTAAVATLTARRSRSIVPIVAGVVTAGVLVGLVAGGDRRLWAALAVLAAGFTSYVLARACVAALATRVKPPVAVASGVAPVLVCGVLPYVALWLGAQVS